MLVFFVILLFCFAAVIIVGAPYVPTLNKQAETALDLLDLQPGQKLLELGSGDGRVMLAAAKRGIYSTGYEVNPLLVVISLLLTIRYRRFIKIKFNNFWRANWPASDGIYVFLHDRFMKKLDKKITQSYGKKIKVVSYGFKIPGKRISSRKGALYLYKY